MSMLDLQQYTQDLAALRKTLNEAGDALHIESLKETLEELTEEMNQPEFWNDTDRANKINQKVGNIRNKLEHYDGLIAQADDIEVAMEMAQEEQDEDLVAEAGEMLADLKEKTAALELETLMRGQYDDHDAVLSLHAGAGGTEAQDWTGMLYRMYTRYCEQMGFQVKVQKTPERIQTVKATQEGKAAQAARAGGGVQQPRRVKAADKVGRNDPCPCGSGKKYKQCCGKNQPEEGQQ